MKEALELCRESLYKAATNLCLHKKDGTKHLICWRRGRHTGMCKFTCGTEFELAHNMKQRILQCL